MLNNIILTWFARYETFCERTYLSICTSWLKSEQFLYELIYTERIWLFLMLACSSLYCQGCQFTQKIDEFIFEFSLKNLYK